VRAKASQVVGLRLVWHPRCRKTERSGTLRVAVNVATRSAAGEKRVRRVVDVAPC